MIYLLVHSMAKWMPGDRNEINDDRRALLKMKADHLVEFIWIMSQYKACSRESAAHLTFVFCALFLYNKNIVILAT